MTTLTLYKGVDFDGVNSFPYIPDNRVVFDGYLARQAQYAQAIHFNRIGDPILIYKGYDEAIEYSYGCIGTGEKKYFIIPDSITVNENNRVYLSYSVDWFTTLKYADAIAFGRAHLIKSTDANPLNYAQGIQPSDMRISEYIPLQESELGEIHVAYTTDDASSNVKWLLFKVINGRSKTEQALVVNNGGIVETVEGFTIGVPQIMNGYIHKACGIKPANIVGIHYIPFSVSRTHYQGPYIAKYKQIGEKRFIWYELDDLFDSPIPDTTTMDCDITSDTMNSVHLIDRYGNIIYTVPYGRTLKQIICNPLITPSVCYIAILFLFTGDEVPSYYVPSSATKSAENSFVLYMCEKVDYNNEGYANWAMGMKGVEIEERRIQKNKALASGLGGSVITGAIGGATGTPLGAGLGVAGGVASAFLSYGLDTYYESQINSLEDRKYQLAQDTMIPGGFLLDVYHTLSIVVLTASTDDIDRYDAEIANFGADCNLPVSSWTPSIGAYKFADVEVIADVPYSIKQNIKQKMMSGIKIVELN
jgi:hypothetical protein